MLVIVSTFRRGSDVADILCHEEAGVVIVGNALIA